MITLLRTLCLLLVAILPPQAQSQGAVSPSDARAVRAVIEAQLDAFRKDDGERAFALATVAIRDVFGTAQKFMEMVRKSYPVVYRPNSVLFETPVLVEGEVVQPVRMTDGEGRGWVALYPMQRQPDGSWRTNGCQLSRLGGQVI